eukprot:gene17347-22894_t
MAARGTIMTNFHAAAPTCTPTRSSILTGLYPWRLGIKAVFEYGEKGKSNRDDFLALVPTIAMIFRENNYTTGHYGKWHVGGMRNDDLDMRLLPNKRCHHPGPNQQGFDDYVSILDGPGAIRQNELQVNSILYSEGCNYLFNNDSKSVNPPDPFKSEYLFECEVRHAIEKMTESVNNNKPFFIQVWFHAPHGPWQTISEFQEPYFIIQRLKIRNCLSNFTQKECNKKFPPLFRQPHSQMDKYKTMVTGMDNSVGVLLRSLKTLGIEKDTIVVFLSDNGPEDDVGTTNQPRNTTSGLRGNKRFLYEGGIRVPCIWQWVGKIPKGKESTVLGISTDILPTVLDAAAIPLPNNFKIDGISLLPELLSHTKHHIKSISKMKLTKRQYFERMGMWHTAYESPRATVVILKTSYGDIDVELWSKEAPLACRNFIQLCMEGYYDKSPVHRIIKQFMIQMGDPTGTGKGGESIWNRPFKDEFHGRIKFNHRGQVAMANENKPDSNHSQFFITLGNTIFNLLRMADVETDDKDVPIESIYILKTEILNNPFDDIIPRDLSKLSKKDDVSNQNDIPKAKKIVKNTRLLSFVEDEEDNYDTKNNSTNKMQNISNDVRITDKETIKTSSVTSNDLLFNQDKNIDSNDHKIKQKFTDVNSFESSMREKMLNRRKAFDNVDSNEGNEIKQFLNKPSDNKIINPVESIDQLSNIITSNVLDEKQNLLMEKKLEFDKLRNDLLNSKKAIRVLTGSEAEQIKSEISKTDVHNPLEQRRQRYIKRKKEFGERQNETLSKLEAFTSTIRENKQNLKPTLNDTTSNIEVESYHGQVLEKSEVEDLEDSNELNNNWHIGKLKFKRHIDDDYRKGGDGRNIDDYAVIDTRIDK